MAADRLATRLSDALQILLRSKGEHARAELVRKDTEAYYADEVITNVQLGQYIIGNGHITYGELEQALVMQHSEIVALDKMSPKERSAYVDRVLADARDAVVEARFAIDRSMQADKKT